MPLQLENAVAQPRRVLAIYIRGSLWLLPASTLGEARPGRLELGHGTWSLFGD